MRRKKYNEFVFTSDYAEMIIKHKEDIIKVKLDLEDVKKVKELGSWHAIYDSTLQTPSYYICHRKVNQKCYKLHRFITNCPEDMEVDHINHDTLDNRKSNLRIVKASNNSHNRNDVKGVYKTTNNKYYAQIMINGIKQHIGVFDTEEDAIIARNKFKQENNLI